MKCIIVDDEDMARRSLSHLCEKIAGIEVVASCTSALEAARTLKRETVDVLLLNGEVPDLAALKGLKNQPDAPQVVLITRRDQPNTKAFDQSATEYLAHPVSLGRLTKALERVRRRNRMLHGRISSPEIYLKINDRLTRLPLRDIMYVEADGEATVLHTREGSLNVDMSVPEVAAKIGDSHFLKVNRSHIVNLKEITEVGETSIHLNGTVITISRARRPVVMRHLNLL